MYQGLGLTKYLGISLAGHALAIAGIGYAVPAYAPAQLLASSEAFSVSFSYEIGQGESSSVQPTAMTEEAPAQALLPSTPLTQPLPVKVKIVTPRKEVSDKFIRARFNPDQVEVAARSANETPGEDSLHSASTPSGGGSVGGVAAVYAPKPPYPWAARVAGFEGRVVLELNISQFGRVNDARIVESSGRDDCDSSALKTVKDKWNFEPAKINGIPVDCTERVSVRYILVWQ